MALVYLRIRLIDSDCRSRITFQRAGRVSVIYSGYPEVDEDPSVSGAV